MSFEICLFDLDGTLTDPKVGITKSFQYALSAFGIHEQLDNLMRFIGPPLRESFMVSYGFSESETENAVEKFREYYAKTGVFENAVYPEIPGLLQQLGESGRILAVATSKAKFYADIILKHFDIDKHFSFVSGDEMDGSLTKTGKREIIRIALESLDPEREKAAIMIGDRKHDVNGAREAGIESIGITWGYGSRDELESAGATRIADSAAEVYRIIIDVES